MSYAALQSADQRLLVLQLLRADSDYTVNERVLVSAMVTEGHTLSSDKLRTELAWLEEQGLIAVEKLAAVGGMELWVAKLNTRGLDVCNSSVVVPGVRRPRPDEVGG